MSCLYADMILDLRKNSMNEVEKRFIDEKLKPGKKIVQKRQLQQMHRGRIVLHASQITKEVTQISPDSLN